MTVMPAYEEWPSRSVRGAQARYRSMQQRAVWRSIYARLAGRSSDLLDLRTESARKEKYCQHYAGAQAVPIRRIKGSESRSDDFDAGFSPRHNRTFYRWMSIAVARASGAILPPVELFQLGDVYFVRDGHHRISVARAYGEEYIDAQVITLEQEPLAGSGRKLP